MNPYTKMYPFRIKRVMTGELQGLVPTKATRKKNPFPFLSIGQHKPIEDFPYLHEDVAPVVGIDFGTSNSTICWLNKRRKSSEVIRNQHGDEKTPSVVYRGTNCILVGKPALEQIADAMHMEDGERIDVLARTFTSVKRILKDNLPLSLPDGNIVTPVELASDILYHLKQSAETGLFHGKRVITAVIAHPVIFGKKEKDNLLEAAKLAGFTHISLIEEPVAAIKGYIASGVPTGKGVLVFDFGGGTLDLAFLAQDDEGKHSMPVPPMGELLGGDDIDLLVYKMFTREISQRDGVTAEIASLTGRVNLSLLQACRKAKEKLSNQEKSRITYLHHEANTSLNVPFNRTDLELLTGGLLGRASILLESMKKQIQQAGHSVDSVLLVGGMTRMPLIRRTLAQAFGQGVIATMHADVAVGMGTVMVSAAKKTRRKPAKKPVHDSRSASINSVVAMSPEKPANRSVDDIGMAEFVNAIYCGDAAVVITALRRGRGINVYIEHDGLVGPPLLHAAYANKIDICKSLILMGADLNRSNKARETALHYAAYKGATECVRCLISHGALLNAKDRYLSTPLHYAVAGGCVDTTTALLKGGANPDERNRKGFTPLHIAAFGGKTDMAKVLIANGANYTLVSDSGYTARSVALRKRHDYLVMFIDSLCSKSHKNNKYYDELYLAALNGDLTKIVQLKYDLPGQPP